MVAEDVILEIHHHLVGTLGVLEVLADHRAPVTRQAPDLDLRENARVLELGARLDRHESLEEVICQVVDVNRNGIITKTIRD